MRLATRKKNNTLEKDELKFNRETFMVNPFELFASWYEIVLNSSTPNPTAGALATATLDGKPSVRFILLKSFDDRGFVFYTNLKSRKAQELMENPQASLCFYWPLLNKQIRIEGKVELISQSEADHYFSSRSRGSKISAWASHQSQRMTSVTELEESLQKYKAQFKDADIPRPDFWSGFRLIPEELEFWKAGEHRLHKRVLYSRSPQGGWHHCFLYP